MKPLQLVVIDTKTFNHVAFEGRNRVAHATFTRTLDAGECEQFRTDPVGFLGGVEEVAAVSQ